jgi:hypothetical protein
MPGALRGDAKTHDAGWVFGAVWLTVVAFAALGPYPTPLVGYGSSAILGCCLSAAALPGYSVQPSR